MAQQSRLGEGSPSRIVVADDHPLIREALTRTIDEQPDLEAVAEASDGLEALELCRRFQPELVLMDVLMPKMDGLEATRQLKRESPRTSVLVLSAVEDPIYLSEALKAGAAGYVQKGATTQETIGAVRKVLEGGSSLDQKVATQLLKRLVDEPKPDQNGRSFGIDPSPAQGGVKASPSSTMRCLEAQVNRRRDSGVRSEDGIGQFEEGIAPAVEAFV